MLKKNQINKANFLLLSQSSILMLPSFLGFFLAFISIPIHLQIAGKEDYGNFLFFHFIFSIGLLLNGGLNKITLIEIAKKSHRNNFINQSLIITFTISLFFLFIFFLASIFLNFFNLNTIITLIGISITIMYFTLEGILQGAGHFKYLSFFNFIFFSLSLNFPSIFLIFNKNLNFIDLIAFSLLIKFFCIIFMFFLINKKIVFTSYKVKKFNIILELRKYSLWYFMHLINNQIYDFIDKYLIKFFLGPAALALYSISNQITGKLAVVSKSLSAALLPKISNNKKFDINFIISLKLFIFLLPIPLIFFFYIIEDFLIWWLKTSFETSLVTLTKIFLIISWLSCISHILITYFEGKKIIKINTLLEIKFSVIFILIVLVASMQKQLILISVVLLFKELILFYLRLNRVSINENLKKSFIISIIFVLFNLCFAIFNKDLMIIFYILIIIINITMYLKVSR